MSLLPRLVISQRRILQILYDLGILWCPNSQGFWVLRGVRQDVFCISRKNFLTVLSEAGRLLNNYISGLYRDDGTWGYKGFRV